MGRTEAAMSVFDILEAFHAKISYIHQFFRYAKNMPISLPEKWKDNACLEGLSLFVFVMRIVRQRTARRYVQVVLYPEKH
jgi:RNase P subunit RPR2